MGWLFGNISDLNQLYDLLAKVQYTVGSFAFDIVQMYH